MDRPKKNNFPWILPAPARELNASTQTHGCTKGKKKLTTAGDFPFAAGEALRRPAPPVGAPASGPAAQRSTHLEWVNTQQLPKNGERGLRRRGGDEPAEGSAPAPAPLADRLLVRRIRRRLDGARRLASLLRSSGGSNGKEKKEAAEGRGSAAAGR